jgi:hypothetical protein
MKESKSMLEVWEWKEEVYNDTKDMSDEEVLKYFNDGAEKTFERMGYKKKMTGKNTYKLIKAS